ncbi:MAG: hypothetical protein ACLR8P_09430 [Clostridium fessum]
MSSAGSADKTGFTNGHSSFVSEYSNGKAELTKNPDYYDNEKIHSLDGVEILEAGQPIRLPSCFDVRCQAS